MTARAYFDHHTQAKPFGAVLERVLPFYREQLGILSASYEAQEKRALQCIHEKLGAVAEDHFFFCSSGAEAISSVFLSHYIDVMKETGKNHLVTTDIEEAPTLLSISRLEKLGCVRKTIAVNAQGQITREVLEEKLTPRTALVSLSWANSLTGVIHPIADLAQVCHQKQVRVHVDASHVIGKLMFRFEDLPIDFLTFDGKRIHSLPGTGGILTKSAATFHPLVGGSHPPVSQMVALSCALQENERYFDHLNLETVRLRDRFENRLLEGCPGSQVFFRSAERLPNCTAIGFPGASSEALLYLLYRKGVYATLGGGESQKLSHILIASGIDAEIAGCALSFSFSYETTEEEVDYAVETIRACVEQLQTVSGTVG